MPRNSSGNYSLPAGNPVVANTLIQVDWANPTMSDIGQALTESLDRFGRGGMLAQLKLADGTVALPAFAFNSEASTGLYHVGAGTLYAAVLGVERFRLTSSGGTLSGDATITGNLGVGGNATVTGTIAATGGWSGNLSVPGNLSVTGTSTLNGQTAVGGIAPGTFGFAVGTTSANIANFLTTNVAGGLVQWGTAAINGAMGVNVGSSFVYTGSQTNHPFIFITNTVDRGRFDTSGNFVVGGSTANARISAAAGTGRKILAFDNTSSQSGLGADMFSGSSNQLSVFTGATSLTSNSIAFGFFNTTTTAATEWARFNSTGLGIFTTTPARPLHVVASTSAFGMARLENTTTDGEVSLGFRDSSDSDATSWAIGKSVAGATDEFSFYYNGIQFQVRRDGTAFLGGGLEVGYRDIPRVTGGIERGKAFATSAGFTLNTGAPAGAAYSVYNDSASAITITQGGGLTLRLGGTTTTGSRTLAARGMATIWFNSTTEAIINGSGVS